VDGPDKADSEHDEEEAWRDLVSRLGNQDQDAVGGHDGDPPPWPAQENLDYWTSGARVIRPAGSLPDAHETPDAPPSAAIEPDDDHYVPPPPPPLPHLDPVTKAAWFGLFGGPGYLLIATVTGWTVPPWAAFCAIAAFVGGFVALVLRMSDESRDGPDDGAVV
jgi:hypothetical protein